VRTQKLMWCNIMRSTKSQKASVLHYSIDSLFTKLKAFSCLMRINLDYGP
jgi:hypothetical protein